jgi:hypothetical protein
MDELLEKIRRWREEMNAAKKQSISNSAFGLWNSNRNLLRLNFLFVFSPLLSL